MIILCSDAAAQPGSVRQKDADMKTMAADINMAGSHLSNEEEGVDSVKPLNETQAAPPVVKINKFIQIFNRGKRNSFRSKIKKSAPAKDTKSSDQDSLVEVSVVLLYL